MRRIASINQFFIRQNCSGISPDFGQLLASNNCSNLHSKGEGDRALVFVPPMINKSYVLSIGEQNIVAEAARLARIFVIDWRTERRDFSFNQIVEHCIMRIRQIQSLGVQNITLVGFCMGGIIANFAASKLPEVKIVNLATPWDFTSESFTKVNVNRMKKMLAPFDCVPKQFIEMIFYLNRFHSVNEYYISQAHKPKTPKDLQVEYWLNDGVDMPKTLFLEMLEHFVHNSCMLQPTAVISGCEYELSNIYDRLTIFAGKKDTLVPLESAMPERLNSAIRKHVLDVGHLGLVTSAATSEILRRFE